MIYRKRSRPKKHGLFKTVFLILFIVKKEEKNYRYSVSAFTHPNNSGNIRKARGRPDGKGKKTLK